MRLITVLIVPVLLVAGCSSGEETSAPRRTPDPTPATTAQPRPSSSLPRVENNAQGLSRRRIERALDDLRAVGLWRRLVSDDLYVVAIGAREGDARVPDDRHLAEAVLTGYQDDDGFGGYCAITFFPVAVRLDLATLRRGVELGYFETAPSMRQMWAGVLGHELAHCLDWDGGEPFAERWEDRVIDALEADGIR